MTAFVVWWAYSPGDIDRDPFPERNPTGESLDVCAILNDAALTEILGRPLDTDVQIDQVTVEDGASEADLVIPAMYSRICRIVRIGDCDTSDDVEGAGPFREVNAFVAAMADERRASDRLRFALDTARRDRDVVNLQPSPEGSFAASYSDGTVSFRYVEDRFVVNVSAKPCTDSDPVAVKLEQLADVLKRPISDWVSS